MPWSAEFLSALARGDRLAFVVEAFDAGTGLASGWRVASDRHLDAPASLVEDAWEVAGAELDTRGYAASFGSFSFGVSTAASAAILGQIRRGDLVQIRAGVRGWSVGAYQPIARGAVESVTLLRPGVWQVRCSDLLSALASRSAGWPGLPTPQTLTADYVAGSGLVEVGDTSDLVRETGGAGLIRLTDSGGATCLRRWTAKTATEITVETTAETLATDDVNIGTGGSCALAVLIDATHPIHAALRLLLSTGAGTAGSWDTLPAAWGMGLSPAIVDADDATRFADATADNATGTAGWVLWTEEEQASLLDWLGAQLAPGGFFLTPRQGGLSVRAFLDPRAEGARELVTAYDAPPIPAAALVTDRDLVEVSPDLWSPEHTPAYAALRVRYQTETGLSASQTASPSVAPLATLPAAPRADVDLGLLAAVGGSDTAEAVAIRLRSAWCEVPERHRLLCRGLRLAALAVGDRILLDSARPWGRSGRWSRTPALVIAVAPDWLRGQTEIVALIWPDPLAPASI